MFAMTKKFGVVLFVFCLSSTSSFAASVLTVSCELSYIKTAASGATIDFIPSPSVEVTESLVTQDNHGFKLEAKLTPVCAADGGPCFGHKLYAKISKGTSSAILFDSISSEQYDRVSTALTVEDEQGFVNCDIENQ